MSFFKKLWATLTNVERVPSREEVEEKFKEGNQSFQEARNASRARENERLEAIRRAAGKIPEILHGTEQEEEQKAA